MQIPKLTPDGCIDMTEEAREFEKFTNETLHLNNGNTRPGFLSTNAIFVLFGLPIFTGIIGNLAVLSVVACSQRVRTRPFLFLISIALSDLLLVFFYGPAELNRYFGFLMKTPKTADFFCKATSYVETVCLIVLVLNLMALSVERYLVICHPFKAKTFWTRAKCRIIIVITWALALIMALFEVFTFRTVCYEVLGRPTVSYQLMTICTSVDGLRLLRPIFRMSVLFVLPFLVMLYCYSVVIYHLWQSTNTELEETTTGKIPPAFARQQSRPSLLHQESTGSLGRFLARQSTAQSLYSWLGSKNMTTSLLSMISPVGSTDYCGTGTGIESSCPPTPTCPNVHRRNMVKEIRRTRKRVMRMLVAVLAIFVICWMPKLALDLRAAVKAGVMAEQSLRQDFTDHPTSKFKRSAPSPVRPFPPPGKHLPWEAPDGGAGDTKKMPSFDSQSSFEFGEIMRLLSTSLMLFHSTLNPLLYVCFSRDVRSACLCRETKDNHHRIKHYKQQTKKNHRRPSEIPLQELHASD